MKTTSKIIVLAVAIVAAVIVILILISTPISVYCCSFQRNNQHPDESTPHELKRFTSNSGVLPCPTITVKQTSSISSYYERSGNTVKFCPLDNRSYVSFNCEANGDNLSWNFNDIPVNFTYIDYLTHNWHNHTTIPGYADIYFVLYSAKNLSNTTHNNYDLRSSVTVFPTMGDFNLNFSVQCSSSCQQQQTTKMMKYMQAERPARPQNVSKHPVLHHCCNETAYRFTWEDPKNMFLYYYEYILKNHDVKQSKALAKQSYTYVNVVPSRPYNFSVRAVDQCGQKSEYAEVVLENFI